MKREPEIKIPPRVNPIEKGIRQTRSYKLITPLYGGGVEPGKADPISVVRATEIRGHLRFWWRAALGGTSGGNLENLREQEEKIWGSSAEKNKPGPSGVTIRVTDCKPGKTVSPTPWGYVAFPLREKKGMVRQNVSFTMKISFPSGLKEDIESALWAWENFGGIGARTRRGFGALECVKIDDQLVPNVSKSEKVNQIQLRLEEFKGTWHPDIPHISKNTVYKTIEREDPMAAWKALFNYLRDFRQGFREGGRFGRSQWPEPDAIRRRTRSKKGHEPTHPVDKFPRAQFGLPIIFKFKDDNKGEPPQTQLKGAAHDRLSSPLILRPIACSKGALGLALVLEAPRVPPEGLVLDGADKEKKVESTLSVNEARNIKPLKGEPDVLKAFLDILE